MMSSRSHLVIPKIPGSLSGMPKVEANRKSSLSQNVLPGDCQRMSENKVFAPTQESLNNEEVSG
jgi:hypothetical protein